MNDRKPHVFPVIMTSPIDRDLQWRFCDRVQDLLEILVVQKIDRSHLWSGPGFHALLTSRQFIDLTAAPLDIR